MDGRDRRQNFGDSEPTRTNQILVSTISSQVSWDFTPPPDVHSSELLLQLRDLNKDVDTTTQFILGVNEVVCSSFLVNLLMFLLACFAMVAMALGLNHLFDCPVQPKIPIFMLVWGCVALTKSVHVMHTNYKLKHPSSTDLPSSQYSDEIIDGILNIFLLTWQILGTYWTLLVWYPYFDPPLYEPNNWCTHDLYMCTLVEIGIAITLIVGWLILHLTLVMCHKFTHFFESS